jgi:hypothetical protein
VVLVAAMMGPDGGWWMLSAMKHPQRRNELGGWLQRSSMVAWLDVRMNAQSGATIAHKDDSARRLAATTSSGGAEWNGEA